jgi:hypothetical protein
MDSSLYAKKPKITKTSSCLIMIYSSTKDAKIFVDGRIIGSVPYDDPIELAPGSHTIKVTKPGYAEFSDQFELKSGDIKEFEIDLIAFSGILKITTNIPKAIIQLDGKIMGNTPSEFEVTVGEHTILVRKDGYREAIKKLNIKAGESYDVSINLEPQEKREIVAAAAEPVPFYKTWWFWTAGSAVVLGGVTTALVFVFSGKDASLPAANAEKTLP